MLRKSNFFLVIFGLFIIVLGCDANKTDNSPANVQNQILTEMAQQKDYSFEGTTAITLSESEAEDVVKFNGIINNKENMYLDIYIESIEGMPEESMEVLEKKDRMFVRYLKEEDWQNVNEEEYVIFSEFKRWNPEYIFSLLKENTTEIKVIEGKNGNNGLMTVINSENIRKHMENQMREQIGNTSFTEEEIEGMKVSMGLTDKEIEELVSELNKEMEQANKEIEEIINTMTVEANYQIHYKPNSFLLDEITQFTKTAYTTNGKRIEETMVINFKLFDYGKKKEIPDL